VFLVFVSVTAVGSYRAIFHPHNDKPLIGPLLVLGGVDAKLERAVELARDGSVHTLVVSDPYLRDDGTGACRPEVDDYLRSLGAMDADYPADVVCFHPDPVTTQGEAMYLREIGVQRGWTKATVLAYSPHVERARILLDRCWDGELAVTAVDQPMNTGQAISTYFYQSGAMVKAVLTPSCDSRLPTWVEELGWKVSDTEERLDPSVETLNPN
jgi:hypothetical protein